MGDEGILYFYRLNLVKKVINIFLGHVCIDRRQSYNFFSLPMSTTYFDYSFSIKLIT